ncbi:MFS transporter, partial [Salmonella enterica subsp. enterica]|nr:MFS transporter [Salmonella enterica subsp. enterica serovar Enteritidis]
TVALALLALYAAGHGDAAWRTIFMVTGIPALIGIVLRFYLRESPYYLNRTGRPEEARAVLRHVAHVNGVSDDIPPLQPQKAARTTFASLLSPELRRRTILILLAWLFISMSYYGVFVYLPVKLAGEGFGFIRGQWFLVLLALAQLPGYALAAYGVEKWGRKPTLIGFLILSAIGCFAFALGQTNTVVVGASLLMSFALLGTWGAIYAFTPEIYPTDLRGTGMGSAGAVARLGGLAGPSVIAPYMATSTGSALSIMSGLLVVAAVCVALIEVETRNRALE